MSDCFAAVGWFFCIVGSAPGGWGPVVELAWVFVAQEGGMEESGFVGGFVDDGFVVFQRDC